MVQDMLEVPRDMSAIMLKLSRDTMDCHIIVKLWILEGEIEEQVIRWRIGLLTCPLSSGEVVALTSNKEMWGEFINLDGLTLPASGLRKGLLPE